MLSIAVVDDDRRSRREIAAAANARMKARGEDCLIKTFADAGSFLTEAAMSPKAMRLSNGHELPISRAFRESATAAYFDHVSGEARKA